MPFVKMNVKKEVQQLKDNDKNFAKAYVKVNEEYELIKKAKKMRKEIGITQKDIAIITGMNQQAISRIEKFGNSPSLGNFIKYLNAAGLELTVEKKSKNKLERRVVI